MIKRAMSQFFVEVLLSRSTENFAKEPFSAVFRKVSVKENFYGKEEGSIKNFRQKVFVSQCQKFSQGNHSVMCFRKFPVAKNFMGKRREGVSRFSVERFCLAVPKKMVGEPFRV